MINVNKMLFLNDYREYGEARKYLVFELYATLVFVFHTTFCVLASRCRLAHKNRFCHFLDKIHLGTITSPNSLIDPITYECAMVITATAIMFHMRLNAS